MDDTDLDCCGSMITVGAIMSYHLLRFTIRLNLKLRILLSVSKQSVPTMAQDGPEP